MFYVVWSGDRGQARVEEADSREVVSAQMTVVIDSEHASRKDAAIAADALRDEWERDHAEELRYYAERDRRSLRR